MLLHISKILLIAGLYMPKSKEDDRLLEFVKSCVGQSVDNLWHTSEAFAQKARESIQSADYELIFVPAGEKKCDSSVMRAQGPQQRKHEMAEHKDWRVLCTTDLGLQRITSKVKPGDDMSKLDIEVLSKAVVIFEHELKA